MLLFNGVRDYNAIQEIQKLPDEILESRGRQIAETLNIRKIGEKYDTSWGVKTGKGLYLTVLTLVLETE